MTTRITITGCCGRMGKKIALFGLDDSGVEIASVTENKNHPDIGKDFGNILGRAEMGVPIIFDISKALTNTDVIIDFTSPTALINNIAAARKAKVPIVIGTTGITDEEMKLVKSASKEIPVLVSSNMSIGVNLLFRVAGDIANALGEDFDVEIVEAHHNKKKDAPSGTAKSLAEAIAQARGRNLKDVAVYGREGNVGQRPKGEIGIHAVRGGDIIGDHTVIYAGDSERIELTHRARSRDIFAKGALFAAKFLKDKSPGLYNMQDAIAQV
ncbi:MAG: 4-hydroxy-tetrahydrodipicolinate reductase [Candidatus Omnitrophota bacterium]